ncbi:contact-dependent growth inhibition system immunity protein [Photorhabdus tasmaniensis]|uniref:contact-dependent growth inhibition system immunity protein n=1 Tax=Photorhabdus tasmaniensis TaxID=1004159 RepID=UPI004042AD02
MIFNKDQDYWAGCYSTNEFLLIETYSGLGMVGVDPLFPRHLLAPDANNKDIGETLIQALSDSRTLTSLDERVAFFDLEKGKQQYAAWIAMLIEKYGYKTKRALFKGMKRCSIHGVNSLITMRPSYHEKLEAWSGDRIKESDYVVLPIDSSSEEIGAALRLAFSRCIG